MRGETAAVAAGLAMLVLAGCGGSPSVPKGDPRALLREAKAEVDAASSAHFTLTSRGVSGGGTVITGGEGDIARPDQLKGSFTVSVGGFDATVKVVSKGDIFEALLPFQTRYARTNPANYGLENPAQLLDPVHGLSSLLTIATAPRLTGQERLAGELLDEVTATVPGSSIPVLPDAHPSQRVTLVAAIDSSNHQVRQMVLTGPFISSSATTFTVTLSDYGEAVTITLPPT